MAQYRAYYFDGLTAGRHEAQVTLTAQGLNIADAEGASLGFWPFANLRIIERLRPGEPTRLGSTAAPDARLVVEEPEFLERLIAVAPQLSRRPSLLRRRWIQTLLVVAAVTALLAGALYGVPMLARPLARVVPLEWEVTLGEHAARDMLEGTEICQAEAGRAALNRLVASLAQVLETPYPVSVTVADVAQVNAFAAPGGPIVVFSGLIERADSADELAGVLAHEMGHVMERHPTAAAIRRLGVMVLLQGLVGDSAWLAELTAGLGATLIELSYSRGDEAEADAAALRILRRAGIRRDGLRRFFERLAEDEASAGASGIVHFLSSHPPSGSRAAALARRTDEDAGGPAMSPAAWRALRSICSG